MNAITTTKSAIKPTCCETVYSGNTFGSCAHPCGRTASYFDQVQRVLPATRIETPVGERSEIDILMGVDNRETVAELLPTYGPVRPVPFCKTHSPSVKAAKRAAEYEAQRASQKRKENIMALYDAQAKTIAELLGQDGQYTVQVSYSGSGTDFRANGVRLDGAAIRALIERLSA